eukprot:CAMPEP_0117680758 /NCGR_PEP_ID=MMETSP0804-20121206/18553_1 /TAXON_ID=1074897 /ORGANISM="Tetraselmis astigmatica, Strain CCMP880" /LENGTH=436 /DNA_ID=CAMNT_0005490337 /DNA_START=86 /DNA_END=1396 /DNA_ORIENTATION=+
MGKRGVAAALVLSALLQCCCLVSPAPIAVQSRPAFPIQQEINIHELISSSGFTSASSASSASSTGNSIALDKFGQSLKTVVISAVWLNGVCKSFGTDWRADLPRFLAKSLVNATVLIHSLPTPKRAGGKDCHICRSDFENSGSGTKERFNCLEFLQDRGREHADAVLLFGSGPPWCRPPCLKKHPQLHAAIEQPWVGPNTRVYQFPTDSEPPDGVPIDHIVWDSSYPKPVDLEQETTRKGLSLESWWQRCANTPKNNELLYIARILDWKGQVDFLKRIDPDLLKGYTLTMISKPPPTAQQRQMLESLGHSRGIDIRVHPGIVSDRLQLLSRLCAAKGLVHYARKDANPRVVYEAALTGTPSLVTLQSRIPDMVQKHEDVVTITDHSAPEALNADFARFLKNVENPEATKTVLRYAMTDLQPETVWGGICQQMGICL